MIQFAPLTLFKNSNTIVNNVNYCILMDNNILDTIIENLFYVLPVIHKKLLNVDPLNVSCEIHLSRLHVGILATLKENTMSISEIAKKKFISKPQMTHIINQLFSAGMVERQSNTNDRRVTNITLTQKGKETFEQFDEFLKTNVRKQLSYLTEKELEGLSLSLLKLREIGSRWENRGK